MRTEERSDRPVADFVQELSQQTSALVRQEIRLAQVEMREKGKRAGIGAGMFGGAGLAALYGVGALIVLVDTAIEPWLAALIVGVVLLAIAGVLALLGRKQVDQVTPPTPERAMQSVQRDVDHMKEGASR